MQAAATRPPAARRSRRPNNRNAKPHLAIAHDVGLLDALPIAAAVIERQEDGSFKVTSHNARFLDAVQHSSCTAIDWNEADCLKEGAIAEVLRAFFDGTDVAGEL